MPHPLLIAGTLQDAHDSAAAWGWHTGDPLHFEFIRPDTGERVRFAHVGSYYPVHTGTKVYLGFNLNRRPDIKAITQLLLSGLWKLGDEKLPPVRARRKDRIEGLRSELRDMLERLER